MNKKDKLSTRVMVLENNYIYTVRAADALACAVQKEIREGRLSSRSGPADRLLDYCQTRFGHTDVTMFDHDLKDISINY